MYLTFTNEVVMNVHLMEFSCLLVGKTSCLGVVLRERIASDSTYRKDTEPLYHSFI